MKVMVIGNCQSKPLAAIWSVLRPQDNVVSYEVHTLANKPLEDVAARRRITNADVVIYQPVGDDYPVEFARSSEIKKLGHVTSICVPMIFFTGLQPDITYVGGSQDRVHTTMGDYHSNILLRSFLSGQSIKEACRNLSSEDMYEHLGYFNQFDASLKELQRRDQTCDIHGATILQRYVLTHPTLFTVNHPMNILLKEVVLGCFKLLNISFSDLDLEYLPSTLAGGPVWPPSSVIKHHFKLAFEVGAYLKTDWEGQRVMTHEEYAVESYDIYLRSLPALLNTKKVAGILHEMGRGPQDLEVWGLSGLSNEQLSGIDAVGRSSVGKVLDMAHMTATSDRRRASELAGLALWMCGSNVSKVLDVAHCYLSLGDQATYESLLCDALSRPPADLVIRRELIRHYKSSKKNDRAVELLRDTSLLANSEIVTIRYLAQEFRQMGYFTEALAMLIQAVEHVQPSEEDYTRLAHVLMDLRQPGLAIAAIEVAMSHSDHDPHHFALRGYASRSLGYLERAEMDYRRAVELDPSNSSFVNSIREVVEERNQTRTPSENVVVTL